MSLRNRYPVVMLTAVVLALLGAGCSSEEAGPARAEQPRQFVAPRAAALLREGEAAYRRGAYQQALALADSAERVAPGLADVPFFRGTVYLDMKRLDLARPAFERAIELDSAYPGARMRLGDIELAFGNPNEAVRWYRREEAVQPHSTLYEKIGRIYAEAGVADSAQTAYRHAIALDSANSTAHMLYGQLLERLGDYETALVHSRKALALRPDSPNYQFVVGSQLFRSGRVEEASGYLKQAADALPLHYPAQYNLGQVLLRLGREEEANYYLAQADSARALLNQITQAEQATSRNPGEIEHWIRLGDLFRRAAMPDRAVEALTMAANIQPGNLDVQSSMAKIAMANGNTNEAIARFRAIIDADETKVDVWLHLGLAYAVTGNCDEAKRAWETVLRYRPGDATAQGYLDGLCRYAAE